MSSRRLRKGLAVSAVFSAGQRTCSLGSYGLEFYSTFKETMAIDGEPADISFKPQGYLFLSDKGDYFSNAEAVRNADCEWRWHGAGARRSEDTLPIGQFR